MNKSKPTVLSFEEWLENNPDLRERYCETCEGSGTLKCEECSGLGYIACEFCGNEADCEECDGGGYNYSCPDCDNLPGESIRSEYNIKVESDLSKYKDYPKLDKEA